MPRYQLARPLAQLWSLFTLILVSITLALPLQAQTETVLYNFGTTSNDGSQPRSSLIADAAGNLYGTTSEGGSSSQGTVFKLSKGTAGWTDTRLHDFTGGKDGGQPCGGLVADGAGNLYGATLEGGLRNLGVVFKLSPAPDGSWKETVLFNFSPSSGGPPPSPWYPFSLVMDASGSLYGVTLFGVKHPFGGTVFKLSPSAVGGWLHSIIYEFTGGLDGSFAALRNLTFDSAGNLYGTTKGGGTYGAGIVFKLTPTTSGPWTQTILHTFTGGADGAAPNGGLIFDAAGNLYGTTLSGGSASKCYPGCGVVFKLSPSRSGAWVEHVLYTFTNDDQPYGGLVADSKGNLYGTTTFGSTLDQPFGSVFKLSPSASGPWNLTVLHQFAGFPDGETPYATLFRDTAGNLYGTAYLGGTTFSGMVFEVTP
jgi:uncharacterized repeat protein (TIGR03803 family)